MYRTAGVRPKGLSHSDMCRARTERALVKHPEGKTRLQQAADRNAAGQSQPPLQTPLRSRGSVLFRQVVAETRLRPQRQAASTQPTGHWSGSPRGGAGPASGPPPHVGIASGDFQKVKAHRPGSAGPPDRDSGDVRSSKARRTEPDNYPAGSPDDMIASITQRHRVGEGALDALLRACNRQAAAEDNKRNPERPVLEDPGLGYLPEIRFNEWRTYSDTKTGEVLPAPALREAMEEERKFMRGLPVWKRNSELQPGGRPAPCKWVFKGGPQIRARLAICEVKQFAPQASEFAATPPLRRTDS